MRFSRDLLRGNIDLIVLSELTMGRRYGYQILSSLRERSAGRIDLKAGTLYPILHALEDSGCVASEWEDAGGRDRKWYVLTDKGRARLETDAREWLDYAACMRNMLGAVIGQTAPVSTAG